MTAALCNEATSWIRSTIGSGYEADPPLRSQSPAVADRRYIPSAGHPWKSVDGVGSRHFTFLGWG